MTLGACLSATATSPAIIIPSEPAVILSHQQLRQQVLAFQTRLAAIGVSYQTAVAIALPNSLEFAIAFLAISLQRAICAPLNPAYKEDEFQFYLQDLNAPLILLPKGAIAGNGEAVRAARACQTGVAEIYWDGSELILDANVGDLEKRQHMHVEALAEEHDVALILHTSGTTGRPKAVPLTHQNLCRTMANIQSTYNLTACDRTLLVMPLFHVHGLLSAFLTPLMSGGSIIVPPRFSASEFWRNFVLHRANWYTAVPTIHQILLKSALPTPIPSIRFIRSCSSPLSPTVHQQLETLFGAPVVEAYAMTEAAHQMTSNPLPPATRKPGSVGLPQGLDLRIMDDEGTDLSHGKIGEICVQGANVTAGYLGDPKANASAFTKTGFLRTGDQGYLDGEGYLFLTGRIKEMINKGGEKISPIEIDNLFAQHPDVLEAVSFAIDDELYGQEVAVALVLQESSLTTTEELLFWFAQRAVKFKIPKKVYLTPNMPKTATGKIQRRLVAKTMIDLEKATPPQTSTLSAHTGSVPETLPEQAVELVQAIAV